jgi:predicted anti-sigma-YlaC factor YlaD
MPVLSYRGSLAEGLRRQVEPVAIREAASFDAWMATHVGNCEACKAKYDAIADGADSAWQQLAPKLWNEG